MKILFAGEESQECTKAFRNAGHEAFSCDLKPCSGGHPEWHYQEDMRYTIRLNFWDAVFFFPDCTYITCSAEWAYKDGPYHQKVKLGTLVGEERRKARQQALQFICDILNLLEKEGVECYGFENPVGVIPKKIFRYYDEITKEYSFKVFPTQLKFGGLEATQYIQPYEFGEDASKKTGLWLFNLPKLKPTKYFTPRIVNNKKRWSNQTDTGQNNLSPNDKRAENRSKTFAGIAKAMADQWG